jgi:hypothetical protein
MIIVGSACQAGGQSTDNTMLKPGDEIGDMTLTTGAADAPSLWAFCTSQVSNRVTTASCRVPQMPKLAIGHAFLAIENTFSKTEESELAWELYFDGQLLDLNKFGICNYTLPTIAPSPSPLREVFMKFVAWDIVLTDLQPGSHTLEAIVRTDVEEYSWVVNLTIEASDKFGLSSMP